MKSSITILICYRNEEKNIVHVLFGKMDKYGRPLATFVKHSGEIINDIMIKEKHGKPYYGGSKHCITSSSSLCCILSGVISAFFALQIHSLFFFG